MEPEVQKALDVIWDYMVLNQPIEPADVLVVLGSRDDRVAAYGAELMRQAVAPICVISGGSAHQNDLLATNWSESTEAEHFMTVMISSGVLKEKLLLETEATNTGENALLTCKLLEKKDIKPKSLLLVTKPYMERRALATFEAQYPDKEVAMRVTSTGGTVLSYCNDSQNIEDVANIVVGDYQRILEYPKRGLQSAQEVPVAVNDAFELLVKCGFNKHLLK